MYKIDKRGVQKSFTRTDPRESYMTLNFLFISGSLWGSVHVFLFNTIILLLFLSHARAVFSDPGIYHVFLSSKKLILI